MFYFLDNTKNILVMFRFFKFVKGLKDINVYLKNISPSFFIAEQIFFLLSDFYVYPCYPSIKKLPNVFKHMNVFIYIFLFQLKQFLEWFKDINININIFALKKIRFLFRLVYKILHGVFFKGCVVFTVFHSVHPCYP